MAGHKPFSNLTDKMSPESHAQVAAQVKEMRREMLLAELRKRSGMTQVELASVLGISQPSLSQMESQEDMQISTLNRWVGALGGTLEVIVHMPDGDVTLTQFDD